MKTKHIIIILLLCCTLTTYAKKYSIENHFIKRTIQVDDGIVSTVAVQNKLTHKKLVIDNPIDFQLRLSNDVDSHTGDIYLNNKDFSCYKVDNTDKRHLIFFLKNKTQKLSIQLHYLINDSNNFFHKYLVITSQKEITIERVDVDILKNNDIYQPYKEKQLTAQGPAKWRPGLGQPLYSKRTNLFFGVEFPGSYNFVKSQTAYCGYLQGKKLSKGQSYTTYKAVIGAGSKNRTIQKTFFSYIDKIRIRPLRLQTQYNSWFDFYQGVTRDKFIKSANKVHQELVEERGVTPLKAYVIDDGWEDTKKDWSKEMWAVNTNRFDNDFHTTQTNIINKGSKLGLWMSPGCNFGSQRAVPQMRKSGLEALDKYMSLAGPKYMGLLEDRMVNLASDGISYFKLDGLWGHLNRREFDLHGKSYGLPELPYLKTDGLSPADKRLNAVKYDELKSYYLVQSTERLIEIFNKMGKVNPDVYIVISNAAYLSPWWLMSVDAVWMINAGDAAKGAGRTQELVYRDGVYYQTWVEEKTQYPINAIFNHEPKKVKTGESSKTFKDYLWMNLSRGTGFVELYLKTTKLSSSDWDILAEGLKWVENVFPYFEYVQMHGGDPRKNEVYGYTGWSSKGGYISIHNPDTTKTQTYRIALNKEIGTDKSLKNLKTISVLNTDDKTLKTNYKYGETIEINISPQEVVIIELQKR
ncbi:alpha-galactosidase [Halosquirtibacter xylanolyticus]|uniref:hypothetical protein n=1 Tax=Halosquirtibacter xylanolyticus TaxID=3374599 RepID=UPI0037482110|nr:alpha-galactosidase [Prolixibacteraceae bacterium]